MFLGITSDWTALRKVSYRAPYLVPCCFHCTSLTSCQTLNLKKILFADDCLCYPEIKYMEVTLKVQKNATSCS